MGKVKKNQEDQAGPAGDIPVYIKVDSHFILQHQVRSVTRFGKGCKINLSSGEEILVNVGYDKVVDLVNKK